MTESCSGMGPLLLFSALILFTLLCGLSTPEKAFAPDSGAVHTDGFSWHSAWHSCGRGILVSGEMELSLWCFSLGNKVLVTTVIATAPCYLIFAGKWWKQTSLVWELLGLVKAMREVAKFVLRNKHMFETLVFFFLSFLKLEAYNTDTMSDLSSPYYRPSSVFKISSCRHRKQKANKSPPPPTASPHPFSNNLDI